MTSNLCDQSMTNETRATRLDAVYIGTIPAGSRIAHLADGSLVVAHPEHPPLLVTPQGLVEISPQPTYCSLCGHITPYHFADCIAGAPRE